MADRDPRRDPDDDGPRPLTPDEARIVASVVESHGHAWAHDHLRLVLDQARLIGEL